MEQPAEPRGEREAGEVPARDLRAEDELKRAAATVRVASGDALIYALYLQRVVQRLRVVSPELVAAVEAEVAEKFLT